MLSIKAVSKKYVTGDLVQKALDGVSLNLRDSEFVAVLGPSGSGKTTLLNVIGGLDRYDSGDLIINGVSTKKYKDRDWDSYRNHAVGFVFQNYNLIPHQSVLANVELALTISGISKSERRRRAVKALEEVGLADQLHKKPNQMSGGQMQRVAIARALVNDPEILLADEPTGALDTDTGIQVMELLKNVSKDRLVVMVTHNPELANTYATRIVSLKDGKIEGDTNPYEVLEESFEKLEEKNLGKSSMSLFTALSLSFNNLKTKKGRTFLTAFAGSIGIIGIALILSLSTGVNTYISDIQKSTMTSYPITVDAQTLDLTSVIKNTDMYAISEEMKHGTGAVYSNPASFHMASGFTTSFTKNNLTKFKEYLDNPESEIHEYVGENGIVFSYKPKYKIYTVDENGEILNTDGSTLNPTTSAMSSMMGESAEIMTANFSNFSELLKGKKETISSAILDTYDVLDGRWPEKFDEVVLVLNRNYEVDANILYQLGFLPAQEYRDVMAQISKGEEITLEVEKFSYDEVLKKEFTLIPECDTFVEKQDGVFEKISDASAEFKKVFDSALKLKIVGIVIPNENAEAHYINSNVAYTSLLTEHLIDYIDASHIVTSQKSNPDVNVLSGIAFSPATDEQKISDSKTYFSSLGISEKAKLLTQFSVGQGADATSLPTDEVIKASMFDSYLSTAPDSILLSLYDTYISNGSYEENLTAFGVVSRETPTSVSIFADNFENKDKISECIEKYNKTASKEDEIAYTDYVGLLMSSVTTIIDVISYVLMAFVSVSLIVSSIMIGIITYISVLERTKEIGILRAIGASRRNIAQVFNAETFIIGLISGIIGIVTTILLNIPINAVIHALTGIDSVNSQLPYDSALVLVILAVVLTLIGGIIPSRKAAKKDPVTSLRSE